MENYDGFLDNELPVLLLCNSVYQGLMQNASVRLNAHLEIPNSLHSIFDCIVHMLFDKLGELFGSQHYLLNARRYYRWQWSKMVCRVGERYRKCSVAFSQVEK